MCLSILLSSSTGSISGDSMLIIAASNVVHCMCGNLSHVYEEVLR